MGGVYLEVTFRRGVPWAAYLSLPRRAGERSARVERRGDALNVDLNEDGRPIGVEILSPKAVSLSDVNALLAEHGVSPIEPVDWAPLANAAA
jgi:hypothetical protein